MFNYIASKRFGLFLLFILSLLIKPAYSSTLDLSLDALSSTSPSMGLPSMYSMTYSPKDDTITDTIIFPCESPPNNTQFRKETGEDHWEQIKSSFGPGVILEDGILFSNSPIDRGLTLSRTPNSTNTCPKDLNPGKAIGELKKEIIQRK